MGTTPTKVRFEVEEGEMVDVEATPSDFQAIIAVAENGDVHVLDCTEDCNRVDLFCNGLSGWDNGIELGPDFKGRDMGLYHVRLNPWSRRTYEGDYDCGIDADLIYALKEVRLGWEAKSITELKKEKGL